MERAQSGVYGYNTRKTPGFDDAVMGWVKKRYRWEIKPEWIVFAPGIVPVLAHAVQALTEPGDGVIIQQPVYHPFNNCVVQNGRVARNNGLVLDKDGYRMNFEQLEELAAEPGTKMMILCSPHNPVGRVWSKEDVTRVCEICARHDVILISDEIHADLLMKGVEFTSTGPVVQVCGTKCISCYAPSKTFNMAGLQASAIVIPDADLRAKSKISFGIDPSKYVVGCVARFSPEKDYETFLFTAKKVCDACDNIVFLMCGDGKTLNNMKSLAIKLGINDRCVFAGMIFDPERAYRAMDLYFIASKHESFGLSLVESWSAGLPAVTSNTDGFAEIAKNGETSLMFDVGDSNAFANAIIELYNNPDKAKALAIGGRQCFLKNYSAEAFSRGLINVYRKIKKNEV